MSDSSSPPPYRVSYSERVRNALRDLAERAKARGRVRPFLEALREIDRRLRIYPQFGQPIRDLSQEQSRIWIGVVPPLVVQYVVDDERRVVMVVVPLLPLPKSGLDH